MKKIVICEMPELAETAKSILENYLPRKECLGSLPEIECHSQIRSGTVGYLLPNLLVVGPGNSGQRWFLVREAIALDIPVLVWSGNPNNESQAIGLKAHFCSKLSDAEEFSKRVSNILKSEKKL
jgi:hypothetical protein